MVQVGLAVHVGFVVHVGFEVLVCLMVLVLMTAAMANYDKREQIRQRCRRNEK